LSPGDAASPVTIALDAMGGDRAPDQNIHGAIEYREAESKIYCRGECRYVYPVRDDIPIMLIDEAEKPSS
jgi:uncharacterized protein YbaR (Trm112 family)